MKKFNCFIVVSLFLGSTLFVKGQSFVYQGDQLYLVLDDLKRGSLIWQNSIDSITWNDIPGSSINPYVFIPTETAFYRAKVYEGTCNPIYTNPIKVELKCFVCGDTLIDYRDGQKYPTVLIGSQCWMAKNLNVGKMILLGDNQRNNGVIEKYCYNNDSSKCTTYGGLYQWDEMMQFVTTESTKGICPCNWHVPSESEWQTLELSLGMSVSEVARYNVDAWDRGTTEGTALKVSGATGFNALLSGMGTPYGFYNLGIFEYTYTSSIYNTNYAWRRCLRSGYSTIGRWNTFYKSYAFSVRCVKN
ncbi:MAG: fibrobacter succinogenes major paralogous domain-containing protein [Paludibacteraceae bacterium]|nr:fibrobacter succinogenes major paralogous domain-containing protein [Paludibacteraceae bacterium]